MIMLGALAPRRNLWIRSGLLAVPWVIVLALGSAAWLWFDRAGTLAAGERSTRSLVRVLDEQTARSFQAVDLTLMGMIDSLQLNPALDDHDAAFENTMRQRLRSLPHVRALFVIGSDGFITQDTDHPRTPRVSLADRPYFQAHVRDPGLSVLIGTPLISRSLGAWFVSASRRIDAADGGFGGIAVAAVEPRYFERFYRELALSAKDSISLFRRDGVLLARFPQYEATVGEDFSTLDLFRTHLPESAAGTYQAASLIDGSPRIISYRALEDFPLVVAVTLDMGEILAGWRRNVAATAAGSGGMAVLIVLLIVIRIRRRTERERILQHRIQAQKLEALGQMTGGVAHDVNNLLAVVASGLKLIRRRSGTADVRQLAETALDAVERGTKLTRQMLAFARLQELEVAEVDVNGMVSQMENLLRNAAGPKVELTLKLAPDVPPCLTDQTQFDAALLNLVVNARDAMPQGGTIHISTARCSDGDSQRTPTLKPGPHARVTVADTGQGMSADVLRRAFEPFFTTKGDQGTGLGLSQVYGFVRQNGGDLKIESEPGIGTSIHLLFPGSTRHDRPTLSSGS